MDEGKGGGHKVIPWRQGKKTMFRIGYLHWKYCLGGGGAQPLHPSPASAPGMREMGWNE